MTAAQKPAILEGVKIVDLTSVVFGPLATQMLGDLGADVIKIEPPGLGDPARSFAKMLGGDLDMNPPFEMDNRSKRSIAIDVSKPEGREIALELVDGADVFLSNVRQAGLRRLGFDEMLSSMRGMSMKMETWTSS